MYALQRIKKCLCVCMIDLPSNSVCFSKIKLILKLFIFMPKVTCQFSSNEKTGALNSWFTKGENMKGP